MPSDSSEPETVGVRALARSEHGATTDADPRAYRAGRAAHRREPCRASARARSRLHGSLANLGRRLRPRGRRDVPLFGSRSPCPRRAGVTRLRITDPTATAVDWRVLAPLANSAALDPASPEVVRYPAALVSFRGGQLRATDSDGVQGNLAGEPAANTLPTNGQLVLYELPTTLDAAGRRWWARLGRRNIPRRDGAATTRPWPATRSTTRI